MFNSTEKQMLLRERGGVKVTRLAQRCAKLLAGDSQAVSTSLAREVLELYAELDRQQRVSFFHVLLNDFSPDAGRVLAAAQQYAEDSSAERLAQLHEQVEPPRQELLRRLNRAPGGTTAILRIRTHLLQALPDHPPLAAVDADFRHLLTSWFNPGFLQLVRLDWRTPASLLERIIAHDAVHEIQGWEDLRRRLEPDRRCFAFFHPALADEPLIFVEVALVEAVPEAIGPLLDRGVSRIDPQRASVAALYSINACQPGLRSVSLGNFLIKQVVELLAVEFPKLRRFCTLSPIPGFAKWLTAGLRAPAEDGSPLRSRALAMVSREIGQDLSRVVADPASAPASLAPLRKAFTALCATYLVGGRGKAEEAQDPVARFHLNNGARLERLNWMADPSKRGLRQSLGMMVNYLYEPSAIEANHDRFAHGRIVASRQVTSIAIED